MESILSLTAAQKGPKKSVFAKFENIWKQESGIRENMVLENIKSEETQKCYENQYSHH